MSGMRFGAQSFVGKGGALTRTWCYRRLKQEKVNTEARYKELVSTIQNAQGEASDAKRHYQRLQVHAPARIEMV